MHEIKVTRDEDRDLRFVGEIIAEAATSLDRAMGSDTPDATGWWTELTLYQTEAGKLVCSRIGRAQYTHEAAVVDTYEAVVSFFGHDRVAKELYLDAKIDAVEVVA